MREANARQSLPNAKQSQTAEQLPLFPTAEPGNTQPAGDLAPVVQPVQQSTLDYVLTRSRRKTLSLGVDNGQLFVRAPTRATVKDIESFIVEKQCWIKKQLAEDARRQRERIRLSDGAKFRALGADFTLQITNHGAPQRSRLDVCPARRSLILRLAESAQQPIEDKAEKLFRRWLTSLATPYMQRATRQLASAMALESALGKVRFRYTRSKWGHCTSAGDIQYNPAVALAPMPVVDYIVAHEVCHLRHRNHSQAFWQLVERACPEWRRAEHWLRHNGHRAEFFFCI